MRYLLAILVAIMVTVIPVFGEDNTTFLGDQSNVTGQTSVNASYYSILPPQSEIDRHVIAARKVNKPVAHRTTRRVVSAGRNTSPVTQTVTINNPPAPAGTTTVVQVPAQSAAATNEGTSIPYGWIFLALATLGLIYWLTHRQQNPSSLNEINNVLAHSPHKVKSLIHSDGRGGMTSVHLAVIPEELRPPEDAKEAVYTHQGDMRWSKQPAKKEVADKASETSHYRLASGSCCGSTAREVTPKPAPPAVITINNAPGFTPVNYAIGTQSAGGQGGGGNTGTSARQRGNQAGTGTGGNTPARTS